MSQNKVMAGIVRIKSLTGLYIRSYVRLSAVFMNKAGSMIPEKKYAFYIILTIFLFSLCASFFINILSIQKNFLFADEAIYYFITQSIVQDGDLE